MKKRYLSNLIKGLVAVMFFSAQLASAKENDLGIWDSVDIEAKAYAGFDQMSNSTRAFVQIPHQYTNTLRCELNIPVKIAKRDGGFTVKDVHINNIAVYPKAAFGFEMTIPVPVKLGQDEAIDEDFNETVIAGCQGWDASIPLPDSLCLSPKYNPGHQKACSLLINGQKLYPWVRNGAWIGSCRCY
ncbi:MAG: hypothetical protein HQK54_02885 [Oligoflexales bacterium]|nr:hypothetical protein [Oligoflexales bacterium]